MSVGYEPTLVFTWMRQQLLADSVISAAVGSRVYRGIAVLGAPLPNIVVQAQYLQDVVWVGAERVMISGLFTVRVTDEGNSTGGLDTLMAAVDRQLNQKSNQVVNGGVINSCVRQWNQEIPYVEDGRVYRQLMSLFSVQAQAIA